MNSSEGSFWRLQYLKLPVWVWRERNACLGMNASEIKWIGHFYVELCPLPNTVCLRSLISLRMSLRLFLVYATFIFRVFLEEKKDEGRSTPACVLDVLKFGHFIAAVFYKAVKFQIKYFRTLFLHTTPWWWKKCLPAAFFCLLKFFFFS